MPANRSDGQIRPTVGTVARLYRERGGLDKLILIAEPALTPGMVKVARLGENWIDHPELTWQTWPDLLEEMTMPLAQATGKRR